MNEENTMGEFNQLKYINEFNKKTYKKYYFMVRRDNEEVIKWMDSQPNKTEYLTKLVEEDMNKNKHLI